jgi:hypothetical protein
MPTFYDALTGETRELNYHGIKCKREPEHRAESLVDKDPVRLCLSYPPRLETKCLACNSSGWRTA